MGIVGSAIESLGDSLREQGIANRLFVLDLVESGLEHYPDAREIEAIEAGLFSPDMIPIEAPTAEIIPFVPKAAETPLDEQQILRNIDQIRNEAA